MQSFTHFSIFFRFINGLSVIVSVPFVILLKYFKFGKYILPVFYVPLETKVSYLYTLAVTFQNRISIMKKMVAFRVNYKS